MKPFEKVAKEEAHLNELKTKLKRNRKSNNSRKCSSEEDEEMQAVRDAGYLEAENPDNPASRALALLSRKKKKTTRNRSITSTNSELNMNGSIEKPTCASLGINQTIDEMLTSSSNTATPQRTTTNPANVSEDSDSDLDLEGIDDEEIDRMLLKPPEVQRYGLI